VFLKILFVPDPDIGMPTADAQKYFKELVSGVVSILYLTANILYQYTDKVK